MTIARRNWALFGAGVALVVVADQLSKLWVVQNLPPNQPVDLVAWLSPILSLTSITNTGIAFGLLPGSGWLFAVLALGVVVIVPFLLRTIPLSDYWVYAAMGLVEGGAIGNLIDRIVRGHVVDFLDVNFWPLRHWPVFNLADSAVVVGVAVLLLDAFLNPVEDKVADVGAPDLAG